MRQLLIFLYIFVFSVTCALVSAQSMVDTVPADSTSEEAIVGFNEEVRKTARRLRQLEGGISLTSGVTGILPVSSGGTGQDLSSGTANSILYFSSTGVIGNIGIGTTGLYLKSSGSSYAWDFPITPYAAGDVLVSSLDDARDLGATPPITFTKVKSIKVVREGTLRIKFDLEFAAGAGGSQVDAQIYRNGSAVGTVRTRSFGDAALTTYSEDISGWEIGDECQIYVRQSGGCTSGPVSNFRIYSTIPTIETNVYDTNAS